MDSSFIFNKGAVFVFVSPKKDNFFYFGVMCDYVPSEEKKRNVG